MQSRHRLGGLGDVRDVKLAADGQILAVLGDGRALACRQVTIGEDGRLLPTSLLSEDDERAGVRGATLRPLFRVLRGAGGRLYEAIGSRMHPIQGHVVSGVGGRGFYELRGLSGGGAALAQSSAIVQEGRRRQKEIKGGKINIPSGAVDISPQPRAPGFDAADTGLPLDNDIKHGKYVRGPGAKPELPETRVGRGRGRGRIGEKYEEGGQPDAAPRSPSPRGGVFTNIGPEPVSPAPDMTRSAKRRPYVEDPPWLKNAPEAKEFATTQQASASPLPPSVRKQAKKAAETKAKAEGKPVKKMKSTDWKPLRGRFDPHDTFDEEFEETVVEHQNTFVDRMYDRGTASRDALYEDSELDQDLDHHLEIEDSDLLQEYGSGALDGEGDGAEPFAYIPVPHLVEPGDKQTQATFRPPQRGATATSGEPDKRKGTIFEPYI